jgi:polar amino acid transport system substrate-binding protein
MTLGRNSLRIAGVVLAMVLGGMQFAAAEETVRIGLDPGPYPPFTDKKPDGSRFGFEPDLLAALCEGMKVKCELNEITWDGLIPALNSNKIDMIYNNMTITDERKKQVDFSDPYYSTPVVFVGPQGSDPLQLTPDGLKGKVIGVISGSIFASYANARFEGAAEIKVFPRQDEVTADLLAGRLDLMISDALPMEAFLKTPEGQGYEIKATAPADRLLGSGVGAAFRKGDLLLERMNEVLKSLISSGKYDEIQKKYFTVDVKPRG